jgi:hypothetical protein
MAMSLNRIGRGWVFESGWWQGKTNPTKKVHPRCLKLKLKSFLQEPFRIKFDSRIGDTFGLNTSDLKEPTQFQKSAPLFAAPNQDREVH